MIQALYAKHIGSASHWGTQLMTQSAMPAPVKHPQQEETYPPLHRGTLTSSARMSDPILFFLMRALCLLCCSQQDMKDEEITDGEGQKPAANTIGAMVSMTYQEAYLAALVPKLLFHTPNEQQGREQRC